MDLEKRVKLAELVVDQWDMVDVIQFVIDELVNNYEQQPGAIDDDMEQYAITEDMLAGPSDDDLRDLAADARYQERKDNV